ncbi:MAG TPA: glycosyltransferase family 2 protein [Acidimicrobiales bacterium]|nr:glycosyltransferase family 2 protein [Acidimicrobiales bacterium]
MTAGSFVAEVATEAKGSIEVWSPAAGRDATVSTGRYRLHTSLVERPEEGPSSRRTAPSVDALRSAHPSTGLLVDAGAGPLALLRTMAAVDDDTTVYVVADRRTAAGDATAAGTLVLARSVGAVILEVDVRPGESTAAQAAREFGLVRRHRNLALRTATGTLWGPTPLPPPVAFPVTVAVPCHILDGDGRHILISVGADPVHRLVPRELVTAVSGGFGTIQCRVIDATRSPVRLDVPGIPVDGPATAQLSFVRQEAGSRLGSPAALNAAPAMTVAFLIATKNGAGSVVDTIRSAEAQGPVYVVSDGSTDDTEAVATAAGAQVLHLEENVGKPSALRMAIDAFGLTRRYEAIAILDDDTVIDPDFLEHCRAALKPGVAIAVGKTLTRWDDDRPWNVWLASRAYGYWRYQATLRRGQSALNVMTCISGSNSVYRSELLDEVLVEQTPYIVDDTYWTLETHRRKLGRIVYVPEAKAHICDPTNLRDWYKQNLRWIWGSFQGVWGHKVGRQASLFDVTYVMQILDWLMYVLLAPLLVLLALSRDWVEPATLGQLTLAGYGVGAAVAAAVLGKWRLAVMAPALILVDWLYRIVFLHAFVKTVRQPRVESCRWESPTRYV